MLGQKKLSFWVMLVIIFWVDALYRNLSTPMLNMPQYPPWRALFSSLKQIAYKQSFIVELMKSVRVETHAQLITLNTTQQNKSKIEVARTEDYSATSLDFSSRQTA